MDLGLSNKTVLITGSTRGLGKAIAGTFLREGANVVVTGRNKSTLRETMADLSEYSRPQALLSFSGDLTHPATIRRCLHQIKKAFGNLDIYIGNLGSGKGDPDWQASEAEWSRLLSLNLEASVRTARAIVPAMIRSKGGAIVFISSIAGSERIGGPPAYGSAKAALDHFAKTLAYQVAPHHIRVNTVAPGNIFSAGSWVEKWKKNRKKVLSYIQREVPMNRFARPEEIADVVAFVASARASFMTGSHVVVDGGQTRGI